MSLTGRDDENDPWIRAIFQATDCLRSDQGRRDDGSSGDTQSSSLSSSSSIISKSLHFLDILSHVLGTDVDNEDSDTLMDYPPSRQPPSWNDFSTALDVDPSRARNEALNSAADNSTTRNDSQTNYVVDDDDDEAGDVPNSSAFCGVTDPIVNMMSNRRILIRILTSQSELYAKMSSITAQQQQHNNRHDEDNVEQQRAYSSSFSDAASQLACALEKIHSALQLADSQIAKWWTEQHEQLTTNVATMSVCPPVNNYDGNNSQKKQLLMEDATVVEVAIESLTMRRDRLLEQIHREERWLLRKLRPQWHDRDAVKNRMGDGWTNNPSPKYDFAELRREYEDRLRVARAARTQLEDDGSGKWMSTIQKANSLRSHIRTGIRYDTTTTKASSEDLNREGSTMIETNQQRRYNQQRPDPRLNDRRVDPQLYPNPTQYGWEFTGSWEAVEFYEKWYNDANVSNTDGVHLVNVKIDWYFTTGTIKTSLDHPRQGRTQMFGRHVTPEEYIQILNNPRTHTGRRYRQRCNRDNNNNNNNNNSRGGRGRANGRGRGRGFGRGRGGRGS